MCENIHIYLTNVPSYTTLHFSTRYNKELQIMAPRALQIEPKVTEWEQYRLKFLH